MEENTEENSDVIKIDASRPSMKDKIVNKVSSYSDTIYWYIKFNHEIDKKSITKDIMNVTDEYGFIMRTYITYDDIRKCIVISPVDSYQENVYYLLNINANLTAVTGAKLKNKLHILFKLKSNEVSKFKVLESTAKVPPPISRPSNYDTLVLNGTLQDYAKAMAIGRANLYFDDEVPEFPQQKLKINLVLLILGILITAISFPVNNFIFSIIAISLAFLGLIHAIYQIIKKEFRALLIYNIATYNFKREKYDKAYMQFKKAHSIDEFNEFIEFAYKQSKYYI